MFHFLQYFYDQLKEEKFGKKFLDEASIKFLLESDIKKTEEGGPKKDPSYSEFTFDETFNDQSVGETAALGPSWYRHKNIPLAGNGTSKTHFRKLF